MCLNCGCGMYDDDMGDAANITLQTLAKAAKASKMNGKDTLEEMKKSLDKITPEELDDAMAEA
jgi:hypothetical protein